MIAPKVFLEHLPGMLQTQFGVSRTSGFVIILSVIVGAVVAAVGLLPKR